MFASKYMLDLYTEKVKEWKSQIDYQHIQNITIFFIICVLLEFQYFLPFKFLGSIILDKINLEWYLIAHLSDLKLGQKHTEVFDFWICCLQISVILDGDCFNLNLHASADTLKWFNLHSVYFYCTSRSIM